MSLFSYWRAKVFSKSSATLLLVTAVAKFVSALGSEHILDSQDPIFLIPFRHVFWIVGLIELGIAAFCFFGKDIKIQAALVAWLSTCFVLYRGSSILIGYFKPCPCLGNLTGVLPISSHTIDVAVRLVLFYLFFGSYLILFSNGLARAKAWFPTADCRT
jgi:hypothetical protein